MTPFGKFFRLSPRDRWIVIEATLKLPVIVTGLALFGFRRVHARILKSALRGLERTEDQALDPVKALHISYLVSGSFKLALIKGNCLSRSLTLLGFLLRKGISAELRVGSRRTENLLEAHAWVEVDGQVVNDQRDIAQTYCPFDTLPEATSLTIA